MPQISHREMHLHPNHQATSTYLLDLSYLEIASIMGIGQESVYQLTYKTIEKLSKLSPLTNLLGLLILT